MDARTIMRIQILSGIIAEQSDAILKQAEQIGRLNEMLQEERKKNNPPKDEPNKAQSSVENPPSES